MQIVCGKFFAFLDIFDCSAGKCEIIPRKADGVGRTRMVDDGGDGEQSLKVNIFVWVFTDNISICVNNTCKNNSSSVL